MDSLGHRIDQNHNDMLLSISVREQHLNLRSGVLPISAPLQILLPSGSANAYEDTIDPRSGIGVKYTYNVPLKSPIKTL